MTTYLQKWLALMALTALLVPVLAQSETAEEVQQEIDGHNAQIAALDKEIAEYQLQLDAVAGKKQTLQNTLKQLDLSLKKTAASISATKNKISSTQLQIQQLAGGIADKQGSIEKGEAGLGESLRRLNEAETESIAMHILSSDSLSAVWEDIDRSNTLQNAVQGQIAELVAQKQSLTDTKKTAEGKRAELLKQQQTLTTQQGSLAATKKAQSDLLTQTKSQESAYQAILAQKQAAKANFESALQDLQSKLQYIVDPSQITPGGKGILRWPLDNAKITQNFGNTAFALSGAYSGKGHNGIDFRASVGTPIKAALTGTVLGTGNTDLVRGCYSYGKWVLIKHANGLDTLYAHLSQIDVSAGQSVATGEVIGFSGETGYATGPHLHFGVYVASATQIIKLGEATNKATSCANATMPVAPLTGYLNPMSYL